MQFNPVRYTFHGILAIALLVGVGMVWVMLKALDGKADDLVRYARIDNWTTQQTESQSYRFLLTLSEHVAGSVETDMKQVHQQLAILASTADLLNLDERSPVVQALPGKQDLRADFRAALGRVRAILGDHDELRGRVAALSEVKAILDPWLTNLQRLMVNLTHMRLELQKRDLANASRLIGINRTLLLAIIAIGAMFATLLTVEARAARKAESSARNDRGRFQDFAEIASDWLWETDADLSLTFVSEDIQSFSGMPVSAHIGRPIAELLAEPDQPDQSAQLEEAMGRRQPFRDLILSLGDEPRFLKIAGNPVWNGQGDFIGFRGVCADISKEVKREGRIRFLAEHDALTGLSNRSRLQALLRAILDGERSEDKQGVLLMLDLDGFKDINDTFGHDVGDALLIAIAKKLSAALRKADLIARLGGDEFAIIHMAPGASEQDIAILTRRLLDSIKQPLQVAGFEFVIGTSIGVAHFPRDGVSVEELMKAADLALYTAKSAGGHEAVVYHPEMSERLRRKRRLEQDLKQAIENDDLDLYIQPQIRLDDGRLIGGEALLRWRHPEFGMVSPEVFVPIAEETGLILPLGQWVLEQACHTAQRWSSELGDGLIAVNVSPAQFTHQDLVQEVEAVLKKTGLAPHHLELEITEGLLMRDQELAIQTLGVLNAMGVRLAIDDFGTGYSSLSYLKRFKVHKVKIDQTFVQDLEHDQSDHSIVRAVVMMSQAFGFRTIAEGVETEAQRDRLITLGCDEAQGYLFGRPEPVEAFLPDFAGADGSVNDMYGLATLGRTSSTA
ncbi:MAG: EAL domain-containing protein [Alphaproteobacteria bacterium]|nr:EAL domain-containing protein [Alphaproteobacteria bacterium]